MSRGGPFTIAIVQAFDLPPRHAHALQILSTAGALAGRGHDVLLFPRVARGVSLDSILEAHFGEAPPVSLRVRAARFSHKGAAGAELRIRLAWLLARGSERTFLYVRVRRHALLALRLRRLLRSRARIVFEFHNLEHVLAREEGDSARAERILDEEREIARGCDGLVAISAPLAEDIRAVLAPKVAPAIVPDGVDASAFRPAEPGEERKPHAGPARLVYAGSLWPHKGVGRLIEALGLVPKDVELEIVGGNPAAELERLAHLARDLPVSFAGHVPQREVARHLTRADVIVLPAGDESRAQRYTSPLKLFEAMATGVPIVAVPTEAHRSILEDGRTAFVAASCSPRDLGEAIVRALAEPARAREIGRAAMRTAEDYTWDRRASRIEELLESLA